MGAFFEPRPFGGRFCLFIVHMQFDHHYQVTQPDRIKYRRASLIHRKASYTDTILSRTADNNDNSVLLRPLTLLIEPTLH